MNPAKKYILAVVLMLLLAGLVWAGIFYWKNFRGAGPSFKPPPQDIACGSFV